MGRTYRVVNVKLLQCAGLVVTPKLSTMSVYILMMYEATSKPHREKLQRMWPLKRIGEEEVVQNE